MDRAFPAACCSVDPAVLRDVESRCTTDAQKKDAHVLAAAIGASATTILTLNVRDFPKSYVEQFGLQIVTPSILCEQLYLLDRQGFLNAVSVHRRSMSKPPFAPVEYIEALRTEKYGLPALGDLLATHLDEI